MNKSIGCVCFFVAGMLFSTIALKDLPLREEAIGVLLMTFNVIAGLVNVFHERAK